MFLPNIFAFEQNVTQGAFVKQNRVGFLKFSSPRQVTLLRLKNPLLVERRDGFISFSKALV